jgi:isopropylmalate/homocitrate/citramalate synthase
VPSEWLEWHGHNDFHKVLVNAATAWLYGCSAANGTLLGIGERTGNPPIEGLVMEYIALRGTTNRMDTTVITDIAEYYRKEIGYEVPPQQPLVGADFNVTRAGIHADGMLKNEEIYNPFDTEKLLKRPPGIAVSDKSGAAGIAAWLDAYIAAPAGKTIDKNHPGLAKMRDWVDAEYAGGRVTAISNSELLSLAREHIPELFGD